MDTQKNGTATYPDHPGFKEKGGTSEQAAKQLAPTLRRNQQATLDALTRAGKGMTADELAEFMQRSPFWARPRVSELNRLGKIRKTGERRKNQTGQDAAVWLPVVEAPGASPGCATASGQP